MELLIKTHLIPEEGRTFEGDVNTDTLLNPENTPMFRFTSPMHYRLHCSRVHESLVVRGVIRAEGEAECARCLDTFPYPIEADDLCIYVEHIPPNGIIDLGEEIRDELLVLVPDFPKCDDACKGVCPQCGTNQNTGKCKCKPSAKKTVAPQEPTTKLGALLDDFFPEK